MVDHYPGIVKYDLFINGRPLSSHSEVKPFLLMVDHYPGIVKYDLFLLMVDHYPGIVK